MAPNEILTFIVVGCRIVIKVSGCRTASIGCFLLREDLRAKLGCNNGYYTLDAHQDGLNTIFQLWG